MVVDHLCKQKRNANMIINNSHFAKKNILSVLLNKNCLNSADIGYRIFCVLCSFSEFCDAVSVVSSEREMGEKVYHR